MSEAIGSTQMWVPFGVRKGGGEDEWEGMVSLVQGGEAAADAQ